MLKILKMFKIFKEIQKLNNNKNTQTNKELNNIVWKLADKSVLKRKNPNDQQVFYHSVFLSSREMGSKAALRFCLTQVRMAIIKEKK